MPVADEEAVLREAPLDGVQRAVQVLLRRRVRALGRREARPVHPVVDLRRAPHPHHNTFTPRDARRAPLRMPAALRN